MAAQFVLSGPFTYLGLFAANRCGNVWRIFFELNGHSTASLAYAWSSPMKGRTERQFFAVPNIPPITSLAEAVRTTVERPAPGNIKNATTP